MPLVAREDALGNKIDPNAAKEPQRKLRPVSGIFKGERLPIVGTSDDGDHVFELPWADDADKSRKVYVANNRDGGLPRFYEKTKDGKFSFRGHLDDGLREGDSGVMPRINGPTSIAPPPNEPDDGEPLPLLRKPNTLNLLKSRNPEKFAEAQSLLKQADDEDMNATDIDPGQGDYYRNQAHNLLQSIMPKGGYSKHASIAEQLERGILRQTPPHVVSPSGRVEFLPVPKPRTDKGDDVHADEQALAAEHQRAREAFQKAQLRVDMGANVAGRMADRFVGGVNSVSGAVARPILPEEISDELVRNREARNSVLNKQAGPIERTVGGAVQSVGTMAGAAPAIALGGAAVSPAAFAGAAGLSTGDSALTEAKDAGLTPGKAFAHAGLQGAIEAGTSLLFSKFLKMPGAEGALQRGLGQKLTEASAKKIVGLAAAKIGRAGLEEVPEELTTAVAQNLASRLTVDPGRAPLTLDEAADVIAQSVLAGSGMNVPSATLDAVPGVQQSRQNRRDDKAIAEYQLPPYQPQGVTPAAPSKTPAETKPAEPAKPAAPLFGQRLSIVTFNDPDGTERHGIVAGSYPDRLSIRTSDGREIMKRRDSVRPYAGQTEFDAGSQVTTSKGPATVVAKKQNGAYELSTEDGTTFATHAWDMRAPSATQADTTSTEGTSTPATEPTEPEAPKVSAQRALSDYVSAKNYNDPRRADLRDMDQEYVRLEEAAAAERKSESRADAADSAAQTRAANAAERDAAQADIAAGNVNRDNIRFAELHNVEPELRTKIQAEARRMLALTTSEKTKSALEKIIRDHGEDVGGEVETQKERIVGVLTGEVDQRNGAERQREAPRPADPIVSLLLKPVAERQAEFQAALRQHGAEAPHELLKLAKAEASAEINEGLDIDEEPRQPTREEVRSKLAEIADRLGVTLEGGMATAKTAEADDSFDFGANAEQPTETAAPIVAENPVTTEPPRKRRLFERPQPATAPEPRPQQEPPAVEPPRKRRLFEKPQPTVPASPANTNEPNSEAPERPTSEAKPKRRLGDEKRTPIQRRIDVLEQYFKPGDIVPSYGNGQDRVIAFHRDGDSWSVEVQAVDSDGNDLPNEGTRRHATEPGDGFIIRKLGRDAIRYRNANVGPWRPPAKEQASETKNESEPSTEPTNQPAEAAQPKRRLGDHPERVSSAPESTQRQNASQGPDSNGINLIPNETPRKKRLFEVPNQPAETIAPESADVTTTPEVPKRKLGEKSLAGRYRDVTGRDLGEVGVKPTAEQAEAVKFFEDRGRKVSFFKSPDGLAANSFHDPASGVTYLNADLTADSGLWYMVGHEFSHASGADQRLTDLPAEILSEAKKRYATGASPLYLKKLEANESLWNREAVARFMGEVLADPALRAKVRSERPTLWSKIVEFVRSLFADAKLSPHVQRVLDEFAPPPKVKTEPTADFTTSDTTPPREPPASKPSGSSGDRYDNYSGFANPLKGTDAGAMADAVAENMGANPKPKWTRDQLARDARAKFDVDPAAARREIDDALASGQPLAAAQTALVNIIKSADATAALNSGKPEDLERFAKLQQAYLRQRSETGSALAAGKENLFATPSGRKTLIAEELVELTPDEAKRLKKLTDTLRSEDRPRGFLFGDTPWPGRRPGTHETIEDMVTDIRRGKDPNRLYVDLASVDETEAAKIKEATGLDVEGYMHSVDGAAIRHVLKVHGDPKEALRGQVPVTPDDFNRIPEIIAEPDEIEAGDLSDLKLPTIIYRKRIGDVFYYVEELRTGRRKLAAKSLYKRKASPSSVDPTRETTDSLKSATDAELSDASGSIGPSQANVKSDSPRIQEAATSEGQARIDAIRAEIKSILGGRRFSQLSTEEDAKVRRLAQEAVDLGAKGPKGRAKAEAELKAKREQGDDPGLLLGDSPVWKDNILTALSTWQPKGTPAQLLAHIEKTKGAKDQAKWIGLDEFVADKPSVTKAEVEKFVRDNTVEVQEVTKGNANATKKKELRQALDLAEATGDALEADRLHEALNRLTDDSTKYHQYQLPGGENYKELLLTKPFKKDAVARMIELEAKEKLTPAENAELQKIYAGEYGPAEAFHSSHFEEPNILAHVRFNERTDVDGKKTLFLEEVQSDWHQAGKRKGYKVTPKRAAELEAKRRDLEKLGRDATPEQKQEWADVMNELQPENTVRVPDAPFKQSWPILAVKRMIRYAADHGFDQIAWTTGTQQADRYDLSKQVSSIRYHDAGDGTYNVKVFGESGHPIWDKYDAKPAEIENALGKELAEKITSGVGEELTSGSGRLFRVIQGDGLKVGGEGMKGFYDKILPAEVNKFAKKFGSKVGSTKIETERDASDYKIERNGEGFRIMEYDPAANRWSMRETAPNREAAENRLNEIATNRTAEVHSLPITEAMKADASQGMLLFADKPESPVDAVIGEKTPAEAAQLKTAKKKLGDKPTSLEKAQSDLAKLEAEIAERQAKYRKDLEAAGILPTTPEGYEELANDPVATRKVLIEMRAYKSTKRDRLLEYWYNSILSGPVTHSKNVLGNVVNGTWTGLEGLTKMVLEVGTLQKSLTDAGNEFRSFWAGAIPGVLEGFKFGWQSFGMEGSALADKLGRPESSPLEGTEGVAAIPGLAGKIIRLPKRVMLATDEWFKTVTTHLNVGVEAYRIAREEGLYGEKAAKRQAELMADPMSNAWERAYQTALEVTFQEEGGETRQKIKKAVSAVREIKPTLSRFLVPFTNIPINSAAQTIRRSPLGIIGMVYHAYDNVKSGRHALEGMSDDFAKQAVGLMLTAAIYHAVGDEPEKKIAITGKDAEHPYSLRIGNDKDGRYFSYAGIEPLATFLGLVADSVGSWKQKGSVTSLIADTLRSTGEQAAEKPLLGAVSDAARFIMMSEKRGFSSESAIDGLAEWAARFGGSFVPAIVKTPERATRDVTPERKQWGKPGSVEGLKRLGDRTLARTDLGLIEEASKFDKWGRELPETVFEGSPITDALFRVFSPTKATKYRPHPGDLLIAKWNRTKPADEKDVEIQAPATSYEVNDRTRYWSDAQYGELCKLTGKLAAELYRQNNYDAEHPTAEQIDSLKDHFREAASTARDYLKKYGDDRYAKPLDIPKAALAIRIDMLEKTRKQLDTELNRRLGEKPADFEQRREDWKRGREQARERLKRLTRRLDWKPAPVVD